MQSLRSAGKWSLGKTRTEASIYQAYLSLIEKAERFIYIENQFFISSVDVKQGNVENRVAKAIFARIKRAYEAKQPFRVILFIPLLPAFEANLDRHKGALLQISLGLQQKTIGRGKNSLIGKLIALFKGTEMRYDQYLMICGLRKYQRNPYNGRPTTGLIYIHSKVS